MPNSQSKLMLVVSPDSTDYIAESIPDEGPGLSPVVWPAAKSRTRWGQRAAVIAAPAVRRVTLTRGRLSLELSNGVVVRFYRLDQAFGILQVRSDSLMDSPSILQTSDLLAAEEIAFRGTLHLVLPGGVTVRVTRQNYEEHEVEITNGTSGVKCRF